MRGTLTDCGNRKHLEYWKSIIEPRQAEITTLRPLLSKTRDLLQLGRNLSISVTGLLTGHSQLRRHL
jgi:hypothetical protein